MKHLNIYKEKDFVYYTGNNPNYHGKNRVAQIDSISKSENCWELKLLLFNPTEQIHCLADVIKPIFTEKPASEIPPAPPCLNYSYPFS